MPRLRRDAGAFEARRPTADNRHRDLAAQLRTRRGGLGFMAAIRLADAAHDRIADVARLTGLVAQDAGPDAFGHAGGELEDEIGIGDLRARHLDSVAGAGSDRFVGHADIDDRTLRDNDGAPRDCVADLPRQIERETLRLMQVGARKLGRVQAARGGDDIVDISRERGRVVAPSAGWIPPQDRRSSQHRRRPTIPSGKPWRTAATISRANRRRSA